MIIKSSRKIFNFLKKIIFIFIICIIEYVIIQLYNLMRVISMCIKLSDVSVHKNVTGVY